MSNTTIPLICYKYIWASNWMQLIWIVWGVMAIKMIWNLGVWIKELIINKRYKDEKRRKKRDKTKKS